ncbi:hypothetical protein NESM_000110400 [Novymonas esmeraldas]|uniref:Uncharacterized protein n=1 Tax=Novymonas esmeraldas TaxID=1808958 RepID=A0AAW0F5X9_9TRYP
MFLCSGFGKVKEARKRTPKTLTEQRKAALRERRRTEPAVTPPQMSCNSSLTSDTDDSGNTSTGCYVYRRVDETRRCHVTVHSSQPPQRVKSLEACRPPPLVFSSG